MSKLQESFKMIDKLTFFGSLFMLLAVTVPLIVYPEQGAAWVAFARTFVVDNFGFLYLALGAGAGGFMLFIAFSKIGQISLGHPDQADPSERCRTRQPSEQPRQSHGQRCCSVPASAHR